MAKYYNWQDMKCVVYGGAFLAGGGGGGMDAGLALLEGLEKLYPDYRLPLIAPEEMGDDQYGAAFGGIAAASAIEPETVLEIYDRLLRQGYDVAAKLVPEKIGLVIPSEQGALTFLLAVLPCIAQGLPMVDADGCDRAVPGLECCLYTLNGIPFFPGVFTTPQGHVMQIEPKDPLDAEIIERICRRTLSLFDNFMGMVCWYSSKKDIMEKLCPGTISKAHMVGKAILEAKENGTSIEDALGGIIPLRLICEGKIVERKIEVIEGHDVGTTTVEDASGKRHYVDAVNESLVIRDDERIIMTCPDVICCIDIDSYYPMSTVDSRVGQNVQYFGTPVSAQWFENDNAMRGFRRHFEKFGYNGGVVRY